MFYIVNNSPSGLLVMLLTLLGCNEELQQGQVVDATPVESPDSGEGDANFSNAIADAAMEASPLASCSSDGFCAAGVSLSEPVDAIWGAGDTVLAISGRRVLSWDGSRWSLSYQMRPYQPGQPLNFALRGTSPDDVWFNEPVGVDNAGTAYLVHGTRRNGDFEWTLLRNPVSNVSGNGGLRGTGSGLWLLSDDGTTVAQLIGEDASGQTVETAPLPRIGPPDRYYWTTLHAFSPDDVWLGSAARLAHWDGLTWELSTPKAFFGVNLVTGHSGPEGRSLWVIGYDGDLVNLAEEHVFAPGSKVGTPGRTLRSTEGLGCVGPIVTGADLVTTWMTDGRLLCSLEGSSLAPSATATSGASLGTIRALWASPGGDVWVGGGGERALVDFRGRSGFLLVQRRNKF